MAVSKAKINGGGKVGKVNNNIMLEKYFCNFFSPL